MGRPTVYEFAGGAPAFHALAADFHARCLVDEQLEHPFSHTGDPHHVEHLAEYWGEVFGGPPVYSDARIGHSGMLEMHARQGMQPELSRAFVRCFDEAVEATLPDDPGLRHTLHDYMESAVAEVMSYDPPESVVPLGLPIPHWDWSGPVRASVAGS